MSKYMPTQLKVWHEARNHVGRLFCKNIVVKFKSKLNLSECTLIVQYFLFQIIKGHILQYGIYAFVSIVVHMNAVVARIHIKNIEHNELGKCIAHHMQ